MTVARVYTLTRSLFRLHGRETRFGFFIKQISLFTYLQAISCLFPLFIFGLLALSRYAGDLVPRYDLLLVVLVLSQVVMYKSGFETRDEMLVICMFHALGVILEWHKVSHGSWVYPEPAYSKFFGVPVYAGFMYASVGSYICQAWRHLSLKVVHWPAMPVATLAAVLIYGNFFSNAFIPDLRLYITVALAIIFRKAKFSFMLNGYRYDIPALAAFFLVGFFIWLAENVATFLGAWQYAYQHNGWQMVSWHKVTSWSLLVIVSIIIVAELKRLKESRGVQVQRN